MILKGEKLLTRMKRYTAATLPDLAELGVGRPIIVSGDVSHVDADGRVRNHRNAKQSNIATRLLEGRFGDFTLNAAGNSFEVTCELPVGATAVQWIFANSRNSGGTTSSPTILAKSASVASFDNAVIDASINSGFSLKFNSAASATLTAAPAQFRKKYLLSDWAPTVGQRVCCRAFVATDANPITVMGNGTDTFANWETRPAGRKFKMRKANGDFVSSNATGFTAAASVSAQNPIVGLRYMTNKGAVTVVGIGDSITEGRGTYLGEGFILPACEAISTNDVVVEYCNLGWSSSPSSTFAYHLVDLHAAGIYPDVVVHPCGSPNDIASTITASNITALTGYSSAISGVLAAAPKKAQEIIWTLMPTNTSVKAYGATDSLRIAYNESVKADVKRDAIIFDASTLISGVADGTGQVQMKAGSTTDNIHPNDQGNLVDLAPNLVPLLRQACVLY